MKPRQKKQRGDIVFACQDCPLYISIILIDGLHVSITPYSRHPIAKATK